MALPTGPSNPDKRPVSPYDLATDIARELRAGEGGRSDVEIIERMIAAALRNGGIKRL